MNMPQAGLCDKKHVVGGGQEPCVDGSHQVS